MRPIIDAHLDISWNALSFDRDQTQSIAVIREREKSVNGACRGHNTVSLPELRRSRIGVVLATVIMRAKPNDLPKVTQLREDIDFGTQEIASAHTQGQLAYYKFMEARGQMQMIRTGDELEEMFSRWQNASEEQAQKLPIGFILSMEGADPIVEPQHARWWWEQGLRTVCLAHYGQGCYAMGTGGDGPLEPRGRELLKVFNELGMILDLVHTADTAFDQAMDIYAGPVFISHGNCRALRTGDRQISDEQIKAVASRNGVIGAVMDNWMLCEGYKPRITPREKVTLNNVADHMQHVCQVTGSAEHAAIGSDLDGGFGTEQSPSDLDTIYDLHKLEDILAARKFTDAQIDQMMWGNWLRFFKNALPGDGEGVEAADAKDAREL